MPVSLEKSQNADRKCFILAVHALLRMLVERAGEKGIGEMKGFFGDAFECISADDDDVAFGHVPKESVKNELCFKRGRWRVDQRPVSFHSAFN
jgi:hypothetical protein